jgi:hypothetical protein
MLGKTKQMHTKSENNATDNFTNKSNVVVNIVNIADVIDAYNMDVVSSCIVVIGIEPFVLEKFTVEGLKRDIRITKDHGGNIYINNMKTEFLEVDDGIKVLFILSEENESK